MPSYLVITAQKEFNLNFMKKNTSLPSRRGLLLSGFLLVYLSNWTYQWQTKETIYPAL